ncbi:probable WRKY transcription factor 3 isoform X2 [Euphorbia lathyris]|uniref:probable WRKY transcription factor 3 isoform X2 n=1 Tax=Euphorbia lathyris TaxID=212925 RepID=UPI003313A868
MAENPPSSSSSDPSNSPPSSSSSRPSTITLPPRSFNESLFSGGLGYGFSPGPMTLVSSYFSDSDDFKSFSHLLAGAMASPASLTNKPPFPPLQEDKISATELSQPANLLIVPPPPMFSMTSGLSPVSLPDSPGFGVFSPQGAFGMTHQQALAQVSAQAAQANSEMNMHAQFSSSLPSAPTSSAQFSSISNNSNTQQLMLQSTPDHTSSLKGSTDFSQSDQRSQASVTVDKPTEDGYNWRKYGQKQVKGSEYPRSYYKCTHPSCPVKKKVERSLDGQVTEIIYKGQHTHQPPQSNKRVKDARSLNGNSSSQSNFELGSQLQSGNYNRLKDRKDQESSQATPEHFSGTSDSEEVGDTETGVDENDEDEPDAKRRNAEVRAPEPASSHRTITEPRIIVQTTSEVDLLDDGYRWRKYGQKVVKGNPYPRDVSLYGLQELL